jgi:hypothetical protein
MSAQRIAAWGVVVFTLIVLAEFDVTAELAVAFAYLILLSVLLTVGPVAFDNLSKMVKAK